MIRKIYDIIVFIAVVSLLAACAKQGMPTGGPKDETPPQVQGMRPESGTLHFDEQSFYIEFDEFVTIKDAENNIIVSPPMDPKPQYSTKGRGVQVKLRDTLQPSTTYVFQFLDAIADFNEGNLLPSLSYVFTTGDTLDEMTLRGSVLDAFTGEPRKETVSVFLLDSLQRDQMIRALTDTAVRKVTPAYMTRCDKSGRFQFNNIRNGHYYVIAAEDGNKDLNAGLDEPVAFNMHTVTPVSVHDSVAVDSLTTYCRADSLLVNLRLFEPDASKQRLTGSNFIKAGTARITALLPLKNPRVVCDNEAITWRHNAKGDTLTVWALREQCDSLVLRVYDTSGIADTLRLRYRPKRAPSRTPTEPVSQLKFSVADKLPYYDTLRLVFSVPQRAEWCRQDSAVMVTDLSDSSKHYCPVRFDSSAMNAVVDYPFAPGKKYQLQVAKGTFADLYHHYNDSTGCTLTLTKPEEYGNVALNVTDTCYGVPLLVQLLNEQGKVIAEQRMQGQDLLRFPHLKPGAYRFRIIVDANGNGRWDTGDLGTLRQPEQVLQYPKKLDVRANWDFEEQWPLEEIR